MFASNELAESLRRVRQIDGLGVVVGADDLFDYFEGQNGRKRQPEHRAE